MDWFSTEQFKHAKVPGEEMEEEVPTFHEETFRFACQIERKGEEQNHSRFTLHNLRQESFCSISFYLPGQACSSQGTVEFFLKHKKVLFFFVI